MEMFTVEARWPGMGEVQKSRTFFDKDYLLSLAETWKAEGYDVWFSF